MPLWLGFEVQEMSREKPIDPGSLRLEIEKNVERLRQLASSFDIQALEEKKALLSQKSSMGNFWQSGDKREVLQELTRLTDLLESYQEIQRELAEAQTWLGLMQEDDISPLVFELEKKIQDWENLSRKTEETLYLNRPYDFSHAILSVHAGAGGTDAQDWTEMLLRMFLRWAERHNFQSEVVDLSAGEEAGVKSATVFIRGSKAYGLLRNEKGVHRLVRISPFDANRRRHTSFALVDVIPEIEETELVINPEDLKIETFRSSGHGGQNVQKTDTAIRITHIPTGIIAQCQNERSQLQNKATALKILYARLFARQAEEDKKKIAELRGEYQTAAWGNQIRSYFLHPYTLVKDHRTGLEVGDASRVLDGDIDPFIWENLRQRKRS